MVRKLRYNPPKLITSIARQQSRMDTEKFALREVNFYDKNAQLTIVTD